MTVVRKILMILSFTFLASSAWAASLEEQLAAVERIRGLRFKGPVKTVAIDRRDLPGRLRAQISQSLPYSISEWGDVLRALRLVGSDQKTDAIVSSLLDLYQAQVLAYYDPATKTFYSIRQLPDSVKDLEIPPSLGDGVNVHELTHALQDQYFQIGARDVALRDDTDANFALHALVEGEASLVMLAYMSERSGGSYDEMIRSGRFGGALSTAAAAAMPSDGPRYFVEMMKFPYVDGLQFVIEAYRRGGWKALDRVYANPPRSSREILHPAEYFDRTFIPGAFDAKPPLTAPALLTVEHLGEFHWRFLTGSGEGWTSDRVTIAQNRFCETTVLADTHWDSEQHARQFYDAYTKSLEDIGSVARIQGLSVRVAYGADRALMERFLAQ